MYKIALPSNGKEIDSHFGHCQFFTIFTVDDNKQIVGEEVLNPPQGCGCKSSVVPDLARQGVTVMLAGNMGQGAVNMLQNHGIEVVRGCSGDPKQATLLYLAGNLSDSGEGCSDHQGCHDH